MGIWEVVNEVGTYCLLFKTLGCYYVLLILLCYARRRGLVLSDFMTDVRVIING